MSDDEDLRYTAGGSVSHVVHQNIFDQRVFVSACGIALTSSQWRGTGSQDEYDRARVLRPCKLCVTAKIRRENENASAQRILDEHAAYAEERLRKKRRKKSQP